jgi:hypothetical protein
MESGRRIVVACLVAVMVAACSGGAAQSTPSEGGPSGGSSDPSAAATPTPTPAPTPTPGISSTGSMLVGRRGHTATLLTDGTVLVAGGHRNAGPDDPGNGEVPAKSAERFDPATGKFQATGDMATARIGHTATRLADGKVLIAGGTHGNSILRSTEIYDPKSGTFAAGPDMTAPRSDFTATLLGDGRVLMTGGTKNANTLEVQASAELFDPATGKFTATGSMSVARVQHSAALLKDGRVLVVGGASKKSETFDPQTGKFSPAGELLEPILGLLATALPDGRVLVVPTWNGAQEKPEVFDPTTNQYSLKSSLGVFGEKAVALQDGRVFLVGDRPSQAIVYDPAADRVTEMGALPKKSLLVTTVLLADGRVLICGGNNSQDGNTGDAELVQP